MNNTWCLRDQRSTFRPIRVRKFSSLSHLRLKSICGQLANVNHRSRIRTINQLSTIPFNVIAHFITFLLRTEHHFVHSHHHTREGHSSKHRESGKPSHRPSVHSDTPAEITGLCKFCKQSNSAIVASNFGVLVSNKRVPTTTFF